MKELHTEIDIQASAGWVWHILTDFAAYPTWNPFVRRISGEATQGARLEVYLQPSGARGVTLHPTVLRAEAGRELRWLGHFGVAGLFDGEHIFAMEPLGSERVHFVQQEFFRGLLVPFLAHSLDKDTRRGLEEMNQALKIRAEGAAPSP